MTLPAVLLDGSGDVVYPTQWITGPEAVAQKALVRLRTHLGEYVLDQFVGIDWIGLLATKATDTQLQIVRSVIVAEIAGMAGVEVRASSIDFDPSSRSISVAFDATIFVDSPVVASATAVFGVGGAPTTGGVPDMLTLRSLILGGTRAA